MVRFVAVSSAVVGNLVLPPSPVALGRREAARAAVPETAVHEHRDVQLGEQEVGASGQVVGARRVTDPETAHDTAHLQLRSGSPRGDAAHPLRHFGGGRERHSHARHHQRVGPRSIEFSPRRRNAKVGSYQLSASRARQGFCGRRGHSVG